VSLGVHFALGKRDLARVLAVEAPEALVELITEELEERYLASGRWAFQSDKAWDGLHRCLTDGRLLYATGPFPRAYAVLGGEPLDAGDDFTACLARPPQVAAASAALATLDESWLRARYDRLPRTYGARSDEDFAYLWTNFVGSRRFLARAARAGRATLFTTDC
jgi:hypothetical protein